MTCLLPKPFEGCGNNSGSYSGREPRPVLSAQGRAVSERPWPTTGEHWLPRMKKPQPEAWGFWFVTCCTDLLGRKVELRERRIAFAFLILTTGIRELGRVFRGEDAEPSPPLRQKAVKTPGLIKPQQGAPRRPAAPALLGETSRRRDRNADSYGVS